MGIIRRWGTTNPLVNVAKAFTPDWITSSGITPVSGGGSGSSVTYQIGSGTQTLTYNANSNDSQLVSNAISLLFSLPNSATQSSASINVTVKNSIGNFLLNNVSVGTLHDSNQALLNYTQFGLLSQIQITFSGFISNPQITFNAVNLYAPVAKVFNGAQWNSYPLKVSSGSNWNLYAIRSQ